MVGGCNFNPVVCKENPNWWSMDAVYGEVADTFICMGYEGFDSKTLMAAVRGFNYAVQQNANFNQPRSLLARILTYRPKPNSNPCKIRAELAQEIKEELENPTSLSVVGINTEPTGIEGLDNIRRSFATFFKLNSPNEERLMAAIATPKRQKEQKLLGSARYDACLGRTCEKRAVVVYGDPENALLAPELNGLFFRGVPIFKDGLEGFFKQQSPFQQIVMKPIIKVVENAFWPEWEGLTYIDSSNTFYLNTIYRPNTISALRYLGRMRGAH